MSIVLPYVPRGKRALLVGRTGGGKSVLARWLIARSPGAWVIINPKYTKGYDKLLDSTVIRTFSLKALDEAFKTSRFVVLNPPENSSPEILDLYIEELRKVYDNLNLCIDELYMVHINGQAGPGLQNWLTLGRESNLSFLGCTQRPRRISLFCFSESEYFAIMRLNLIDDRKRVYEFVGDETVLRNPAEYHWRWYDVNADTLNTFGPVPV